MEVPKQISAKYNTESFKIVRDKNPEVKGTPGYYLDNCEGMYSLYIRGRSGIPYSYAAEFDLLRAYSDGNQSEDIYKAYFSKERPQSPASQPVSDVDGVWNQTRDDRRKGFMNVLWKVISPAPKLAAKLQGMFMKAEYDIVCNPTDPVSKSVIEDKELELWAIKKDLEFLKTYHDIAGVVMEEPDYMPETLDELKLYKERGGFKPEMAMFMETAIYNSLKHSMWKEIKRQVIKDLLDFNLACAKEYYDDTTGLVKAKYVNPKYATVQASRYHDFQDSEWAFHMEEYTVSELLERGIPREQLRKAAKSFAGYAGNPVLDEWDTYDKITDSGTYRYDFFKVAVLEGSWIDTDTRQDLIRTNEYGGKKIIRQDYGTKVVKGEKMQTRLTDIRRLYKCSWVIGSDVIFDYGESNDYVRTGRGVMLPYHFIRLDGKSITEQLIPIYDNFQILWLKYQNALAQAVNQGYAINYDAISQLSLGSRKASQEEIIRRFLDTGILIFKQTDTRGRITNSNLPVYQLKGGIGDTLNEVRQMFLFNIQMVEYITGINPLALGTSLDPNTPVGTQEMAVAATNDTLRPMLDAVIDLKEAVSKGIMNCISIKIRYDKVYQDAYSEILGARGLEVLKIAAKRGARFDINLEAKPTDVEKREIYESAKISLQNGRNGQPGITEADFFKILSIVNGGGSLKLAEMILESSIRRKTEQMQQYALQTQQLQQQGALQQKQEATMAELAKVRVKGEEDRLTKTHEGMVEVYLKTPNANAAQAEMATYKAALDTIMAQSQAPQVPEASLPEQPMQ